MEINGNIPFFAAVEASSHALAGLGAIGLVVAKG
jgi:hypothetical protein